LLAELQFVRGQLGSLRGRNERRLHTRLGPDL
jgi:hypothetical protein